MRKYIFILFVSVMGLATMSYTPVVGQAESPPELVSLAEQATDMNIDAPVFLVQPEVDYQVTYSNDKEDPGLHSDPFVYDYNVTELRVVHGAINLLYKQEYWPDDVEPARLII